MRHVALFALAAAAVSASVCGGELVLAERGRPVCTAIALKGDIGPSVKYAADELRRCIRKMTDVELPILSAASSAPSGMRRRIVLVRTDEFGPDGFRLFVKGGDLTIAGGKRGVLYGAYEILETYGGCGWYASWHEVIPQRDSFSVPDDLDDTQKPAFEMRHTSWKDVKFNEDFAVRLRFNGHPGDGRFNLGEKHGGAAMRFVDRLPVCHTFRNFLPPEKAEN